MSLGSFVLCARRLSSNSSFFFFSSRRRHTRLQGDWSSDVCSSDLQAQLKHALGPLYAGDKIHLVALRGEKRVEADVELVDKIPPYEYPFLGILPMRPFAGEP